MSRRGNTDATCAKFTRFDRMYSHQPAAQVQATQSRATGVNTSTLALTQCLQPGMAVINIPKHHVLRRFSQAIPPLPPALSLARVSVPTARSPGDGCEFVNVIALAQCLQPAIVVINIPKHHVLRRFGQAIPPLPPARSLARVSVPCWK